MVARGDIWLAEPDPSPAIGHEQANARPVLVVSVDRLNRGPSQLVVALPLTKNLRPNYFHVFLRTPEGGVRIDSAVLCEQIRSISQDRLVTQWGRVRPSTMRLVDERLRLLLGL